MTADGRDPDRGQDGQRLDRGAAAVSEDASCVGPWQVDRLRAASGPGVTAAEARSALERHGVRVAELPRLPAQPPSAIARHPEFTDLLARLGRKLSLELVFGSALTRGFRLLKGVRLEDGRRLDAEAIEKAQQQTPTGALHEDWQRALSILADAAQQPRALDDIAFWEVAEVLRSLARLGYSQRALTEQAVRLSLERGEAEVLAAAAAEEREGQETRGRAAAEETEPPAEAPDHSPGPDTDTVPDPPAASHPARTKPPQPVTDLQARAIRGRTDIVQLSWSPPAEGVVSWRMAPEPPPWPAGTIIGSGDADSYGRPLGVGGALGPDGRMSRELALPQARAFVTAMTVRDTDAAVGRTVEVTRDAPVRGLSALRLGEEVRLTWIWPEEAIAAHVAWQPSVAAGDQPGPSGSRQQRSCSRRAFDAEGGFAADMGHGAQHVEVWAVIADRGGEHVTAPAELEVPATGIPVNYDVRRVPGLLSGFVSMLRRRRRRELRVSTILPCVLPDLIVVECRHASLPLVVHGGETLTRIPGRPMDASTPVRIVLELGPDRPSWIVCFIDPAKPAAARGRVTLFPPPVRRLQVR
jgi:hypothetical protein